MDYCSKRRMASIRERDGPGGDNRSKRNCSNEAVVMIFITDVKIFSLLLIIYIFSPRIDRCRVSCPNYSVCIISFKAGPLYVTTTSQMLVFVTMGFFTISNYCLRCNFSLQASLLTPPPPQKRFQGLSIFILESQPVTCCCCCWPTLLYTSSLSQSCS
jgi:hypothetical protein